MGKKRFKGLKIAACIFLGLWVTVLLVLQLLMTDSFLTRTANRLAAGYIDGEVRFGRIRASAFRSFPNLEIDIDDGFLVYPHGRFAAYDTTGYRHPLREAGRDAETDTLLSFRRLSASVDYMAALRGRIHVRKAVLDGARIFAHRYDTATANWDVLTFLAADPADTASAPLQDVTVNHVSLTGRPHIVFTAPSDTLFAVIDSRDLRFEGRLALRQPERSRIGLLVDSLHLAGRLPADSAAVDLDRFALQHDGERFDIDAAARLRLGLSGLGRMELPLALRAGITFPEPGFKAVSVRDLQLEAATLALTGEADVRLQPDSTYLRAEAAIDDCAVADVTAFLGKSLFPDLLKLKTDAVISLTALCDGWWIPARRSLPELVAEISIPKSSLAWKGFDYDGRLAAEINAQTDRYGNLSLTLDGIDLDMAGVTLTGSGFSEDVLCDDPLIGIDLEARADLDVINGFLPEGMSAGGAVEAALAGMVMRSDLDLYNFSRADLEGSLISPGLHFTDEPDSLSLFLDRTEIRLARSESEDMSLGSGVLGLRALVDSLHAQYGKTTFIRGTAFGMTAQNAAETLSEEYGREVHPIVGTLTAGSVAMTGEDSLFVAVKESRNRFKYSNKTLDSGTVPLIVLTSRNEEIQLRQGVNRIQVRDAAVSANAIRREALPAADTLSGSAEAGVLDEFRSRDLHLRLDESLARYVRDWDASGSLDVGDGLVISPYFPLRNAFSDLRGTFTNDQVRLSSLTVTSGQSDVSARGQISGLRNALLRDGSLNVDLSVTSGRLNANELLGAYDAGTQFRPVRRDIALDERISDAEYLARVATDTLSGTVPDGSMIILPGNLNATVKLEGNEIRYSDLMIDWFASDILVKDRCLQVTNTVATSNMGDIYFEGFYSSRTKRDLTAGFDINMVDITADKVITLVPAVDSIIPLLKSFKGMLDCEMAATARLDTSMNILPPTISGVMKIKGTGLSLEDNDAIRKIARVLMFKDRETSRIDDMSVEGIIGDNFLEIFPFILGVDRYQLALSGLQSFDEDFDYHVSVLRSPLPFRFGIDIFGNFDNWRYRIGKARYRTTHVPVYTARIDTLQYNLVQSIHDIFSRGVETAVRQNEAAQTALSLEGSYFGSDTSMDGLSTEEQVILDSLQYRFDHPVDSLLDVRIDSLKQAVTEQDAAPRISCIDRIRAFFCPRKREEIRLKQEALLREEEE